MTKQNRVFIIDVDNTLIDTEKIKIHWRRIFKKDFIKSYNQSKLSSGLLNTSKMIKILAQKQSLGTEENIKKIIFNTPFKKYLFPGSLTAIRKLRKLGKVMIFSLGDRSYQAAKIKNSGMEKAVGKKNVIIVKNKINGLIKLIDRLRKKGFSNIVIVDDVSNILVKAHKIYSRIISVWVKYGKYKDQLPTAKEAITFETDSFENASIYLERFVSTLSIPEDQVKLSILKDIDKKQVQDLIHYTKGDSEIRKYTHDLKRFRTIKTFEEWRRNKKTIYSLTDKKGNLLGIIWFARKKIPKIINSSFTFAIRIYPPLRRKRIAKKFMMLVFENFMKGKNHSIWLKTKSDNTVAKRLYESFGFKKISETKDREILMVYPGEN